MYVLRTGAELVELAHQASALPGPAGAFDELLADESGVSGVAGEHVPDGDQDRVLQGDQGSLLAAAGSEVGVLGAGGGDGGRERAAVSQGAP